MKPIMSDNEAMILLAIAMIILSPALSESELRFFLTMFFGVIGLALFFRGVFELVNWVYRKIKK